MGGGGGENGKREQEFAKTINHGRIRLYNSLVELIEHPRTRSWTPPDAARPRQEPLKGITLHRHPLHFRRRILSSSFLQRILYLLLQPWTTRRSRGSRPTPFESPYNRIERSATGSPPSPRKPQSGRPSPTRGPKYKPSGNRTYLHSTRTTWKTGSSGSRMRTSGQMLSRHKINLLSLKDSF